MAEISDVIKKEPADFGYKVWDGPSLSDLVKKQSTTLSLASANARGFCVSLTLPWPGPKLLLLAGTKTDSKKA